MGVKDALGIIFILFFLWLSLNIGFEILDITQNVTNSTLYNMSLSNNTRELIENSTGSTFTQANDMLDFFNTNYLWLVVSFMIVILITNASTSLNPIAFGVFNVAMFIFIYITANYIVPLITGDYTNGLFANDRATNIFDFITNDWWYLFLALFVGSLYGYIKRGGTYEL